MKISASIIQNNVENIYQAIEKARLYYKANEVVGFSNSLKLDDFVLDFRTNVDTDGNLTVNMLVDNIAQSGILTFSPWEIQENEIPQEEYGNHIAIFVTSFLRSIGHIAYKQWSEQNAFETLLNQGSYDELTLLLPKGFGMVLEPEVRGYDIQVTDNEGELLYRAAGENALHFAEDPTWSRLNMEIKLAWIEIYANGLAFKDFEVIV